MHRLYDIRSLARPIEDEGGEGVSIGRSREGEGGQGEREEGWRSRPTEWISEKTCMRK